MVFGPTILYRVILFFYAYCLIYLLHHDRTFTAIAITCITFYAVLKIGSRGGIIAIGVIWLILIIRYLSINFLIKMLVALMLLWYFLDWEEIFSSRAFYFSSDSESTNIRLDKLSMVEQFLNSKEIWFGMSNPSALVGNYPHNIFAEILIYHGLIAFGIFFVLNMISLYIVFRNFSQKKWIFNFALLFAPIFVGAQFSGNLLDNYFYITAMAFLIITHASKYTTIKFSLNQKKSALCASNKF